MIRTFRLIIAFILICTFAYSQETDNYYWIEFSDKQGTTFLIEQPEEFLTIRSIQRRAKQNIAIIPTDLPVSEVYLDSIRNRTIQIIHTSKWLNGATLKTTASKIEQLASDLPFIIRYELSKPGLQLKSTKNKFSDELFSSSIDTAYYGYSVFHTGQLHGQTLHENGYLGQGIHIAVLDAGFLDVDQLPSFMNLISENRILGTRDIVNPHSNIFDEDNHGMNVLSTMAGELPGKLIGTAPKASYYLIRSEDAHSEYIIEEDNWVVAAEYADSLGVDIINSSLGYSEFDHEAMNHTYADMDGQTTRISRAANLAVQKGMLVISSAGNEANDPWHYLVAPSDGDMVIGVGAVNKENIWAPFSSLGPASDGDIKPNVAALGWRAFVQRADGSINQANGTSFSSPILTGMAACLWQAFPMASNLQIKEAIEKSASQYESPDAQLGYGIPDFRKAANSLAFLNRMHTESSKQWIPSSNPFSDHIRFYSRNNELRGNIKTVIYSINGTKFYSTVFPSSNSIVFNNLSNLPKGIYLVHIESPNNIEVHKVVKM